MNKAIAKQESFRNISITHQVANNLAEVFNQFIKGGAERAIAQRFLLQCVVSLFAQDIGLLPKGLFTQFLEDCYSHKFSFDHLLGGLFQQMGSKHPPPPDSRYRDIPYFNGGLFATVEPLPLTPTQIDLLLAAAGENWAEIEPAIFGTLFQSSLDQKERHTLGAHYTSEADIYKVILPTIVRPWRERIESAKSLKELWTLQQELSNFKVLDPACGSGNFLYVAYRELKKIETQLLLKINELYPLINEGASYSSLIKKGWGGSLIKTTQFYGIDTNSFAVELAKVTLMVAKKAIETKNQFLGQIPLTDEVFPLDNLDQNICCNDALFCDWIDADVIIGNPPYQSKNKMQKAYGVSYLQQLRAKYPQVPGRADYCVYWFRRAHEQLKPGGRAGLIGTNTIRQNYSREGGLDYIVNNGGTIIEAVSNQIWSGDAVVQVAIVNWIKGKHLGKKKLFNQLGNHQNSPWLIIEVDTINSSLAATVDISQAQKLLANANSDTCYQGQTNGHQGFLISPLEAEAMIKQSPKNREVLFPYLIGDDLLSENPPSPLRYVIDFHPRNLLTSSQYTQPFEKIKQKVLPTRQQAAKEEEERNSKVLQSNPKAKVNQHHHNFLNKWWLLSYPRPELITKLTNLSRYIVCSRVTKRPIFAFIDATIRPSDALQVFPLADDYSFGILQSNLHWEWFKARCSTLGGGFRYTSNTVFDSFPFPQSPTLAQVQQVAEVAVKLRQLRAEVMMQNQWSLRELYRTLALPGENIISKGQMELDRVVKESYGLQGTEEPLQFLLDLNLVVAKREAQSLSVVAPGLPPWVSDTSNFITDDRVKMINGKWP